MRIVCAYRTFGEKNVDILSTSVYITIPQIAEQLGLNARGIAKHIKNLQDEGIIKRIGPDKGGHWEIIEN